MNEKFIKAIPFFVKQMNVFLKIKNSADIMN